MEEGAFTLLLGYSALVPISLALPYLDCVEGVGSQGRVAAEEEAESEVTEEEAHEDLAGAAFRHLFLSSVHCQLAWRRLLWLPFIGHRRLLSYQSKASPKRGRGERVPFVR